MAKRRRTFGLRFITGGNSDWLNELLTYCQAMTLAIVHAAECGEWLWRVVSVVRALAGSVPGPQDLLLVDHCASFVFHPKGKSVFLRILYIKVYKKLTFSEELFRFSYLILPISVGQRK